MKTINQYSCLLASMALLLVACQNQDELKEWAQDSDMIQVSASISGLQTRVNSEGNGNTWVNGDKIRVMNTSAKAIAGKEKATFVYKNNAFALDGKDYVVWVEGENTFQAYYPSGGMAEFNKFILGAYQNTLDGLRANDWMIAEAKSTQPTDNSLNLTFYHQLAKVVVKITKYNDQYGGALPAISNVYFTNLSTDDKRVSHPYNSDYEGNDKERVNAYVESDNSSEGKHVFMAVLPSGKYVEGKPFMEFSVNGEVVKVYPNSMLTDSGLEKGKVYTLLLTVGKNKVGISSVTVTDWTDSALDGGTAEEVVTP